MPSNPAKLDRTTPQFTYSEESEPVLARPESSLSLVWGLRLGVGSQESSSSILGSERGPRTKGGSASLSSRKAPARDSAATARSRLFCGVRYLWKDATEGPVLQCGAGGDVAPESLGELAPSVAATGRRSDPPGPGRRHPSLDRRVVEVSNRGGG